MPVLALAEIIAEFRSLAGKLGADTTAASVLTATAECDGAVAAAAAQSKLGVVAISRDADKAYFADATKHPDLSQLSSLGVRFPRVSGKPTDYFIETSWEQIGKHPADVSIYDARESASIAAAAAKVGTWTSLPAVRAGQVHPWYPAAPYSYHASGPLYREVATWLTKARPLDVS